MAETRKILGQKAIAATLWDLYTVPAATQAIVSTIVVCNQDASSHTYRISVAYNGAVDATKQYLFYNVRIAANTTYTITIGITLGAADIIRVYCDSATVSFNAFGVELT